MENQSSTTLARLETLCSELGDLAYVLDRRGGHTAADLATSLSRRLREIVDASQHDAIGISHRNEGQRSVRTTQPIMTRIGTT
jgi:hypothetical protein